MKKSIRLFAALAAALLSGCFAFAGCGKALSANALNRAVSETTDYVAVVEDQAICGDKLTSIGESIDSYMRRRHGYTDYYRNGTYYDGSDMYVAVCYRLYSDDHKAYDFINVNLLNGEITAVFENCSDFGILFSYQNYLFVHKGQGDFYSFLNLSDFSEIETSTEYFLNENGNLYGRTESDTGITITSAKISDDGDRVETTGGYTVLYKGYSSYGLFRVYDDCVVTDKFIYKIASDEYDYCLFKHDYLSGNYYIRTHYIVEENEGVISTHSENSYLRLDNSAFVDKTQSELKKERIRLGASVVEDKDKFRIHINYIGFSESISFQSLKKNKYVAALMARSAEFNACGFVGDNVVLAGGFSDSSSDYCSVLLVNIFTEEATFLGTFSMGERYNRYYSAHVLEVEKNEA